MICTLLVAMQLNIYGKVLSYILKMRAASVGKLNLKTFFLKKKTDKLYDTWYWQKVLKNKQFVHIIGTYKHRHANTYISWKGNKKN